MKFPEKIFHSPFYLYSEFQIEENVNYLRNFWQDFSEQNFKFYFSVKSNPNLEIIKTLAKLVDGFDVSSLAEAELIRSIDLKLELTWSGPAKTNQAMKRLDSLNVFCVHLDSINEFEALKKQNNDQKISFRLSLPDSIQKLGFSTCDLKKFKSIYPDFTIDSIHTYLGRETFSAAEFVKFLERVNRLSEEGIIARNSEIFLGAGLPGIDIINNHPVEFSKTKSNPKSNPKLRINIEVGRSLMQNTGWYGTQVLSLKEDAHSKKKFCIIDGGLQHFATYLSSPKYNLSSFKIKYFRKGKELVNRDRTITLCGSLSLWHDNLVEDISAPGDLQRGDFVVINQLGCYGFTAGSNQFLGPSKVTEWLLRKNNELIDVTPKNLKSYLEGIS